MGKGMVLRCLGSGSSGNCYVLQGSEESLVIECGVDFQQVMEAVNWHLSEIVGCVVSHRHGDHAKFLDKFLERGINVLALPDVFQAKKVKCKAFCKEIEPMKWYKVGGFKVYPIPVAHDVPCVAYIIEHAELGRLVFVTDTMMLEYKLPAGVNHLMLEANYSDRVLNGNIMDGVTPVATKDRLLHSHMELDTTLGILRANDITDVKEVVLVHLSSRNADPERFCDAVRQATGKPAYAAHKGLVMELTK